jgi:hypothetical protein
MLEGLIVLFIVLWALGFFVVHIGAVIHLLLVLAVIVLIVRMIRPSAAV